MVQILFFWCGTPVNCWGLFHVSLLLINSNPSQAAASSVQAWQKQIIVMIIITTSNSNTYFSTFHQQILKKGHLHFIEGCNIFLWLLPSDLQLQRKCLAPFILLDHGDILHQSNACHSCLKGDVAIPVNIIFKSPTDKNPACNYC